MCWLCRVLTTTDWQNAGADARRHETRRCIHFWATVCSIVEITDASWHDTGNWTKDSSLSVTLDAGSCTCDAYTFAAMIKASYTLVTKSTARSILSDSIDSTGDKKSKPILSTFAMLRFSPASYASAGIVRAEMSVRPSVCPSHSGIVSKWTKSWFMHGRRAWRL